MEVASFMGKEETWTEQDREKLARAAIDKSEVLDTIVEQLAQGCRMQRQHAAAVISLVASLKPELLTAHTDDITDALNRPEAATRWELLHAISYMGKAGQEFDDDVLASVEDSLYDEDNGIVREAAFDFLCGYGSASASNAETAWPLIDEAIQCYHGNYEFNKMLRTLIAFAQADIPGHIAEALGERMAFDAASGTGTLKKLATEITEACAAHLA